MATHFTAVGLMAPEGMGRLGRSRASIARSKKSFASSPLA
jgi:hypothetical protein